MKIMKKSQKPLNTLECQKKIERRAKRAYAVFACLVLSMAYGIRLWRGLRTCLLIFISLHNFS